MLQFSKLLYRKESTFFFNINCNYSAFVLFLTLMAKDEEKNGKKNNLSKSRKLKVKEIYKKRKTLTIRIRRHEVALNLN